VRREPLESFWDFLEEDADAIARCWLIIPPPEVKEAVRAVQESFAELDWVAPVPAHFLHVSAPTSAAGWGGLAPFEIAYRSVNCFHDATIVEAHAGAGAPFPPAPFLPHLSIGYFRRAERPDALREAIAPHRHVELGSGIVEEVVVCDVPIAKSRFFEPWRVIESVRLAG
jgi:2'-5' RNA ligase